MSGSNTPNLWSFGESLADAGDIAGYTIEARDGEIGKVDSHDVETGTSHLIVATGPWIFGRTVMLPAGVVEHIDHEHRRVVVSATKDQIKNAPEYEADRRNDHAYRDELAGWYGTQAPGPGSPGLE